MVCVNSHMPLGDDPAATTRRNDEIAMLRALGVGCLRLDFRWAEIEAQPGDYEFSGLDTALAGLSEAGIDVLALLTGAAPWAVTNDDDSTIDPADFAAFAAATATHFSGRLKHYEIWNEPNWYFWRPEPNPHAYGALLKSAAAAIRSADPAARVVLGGNFSLEGMFAGRLWQFLYDVAEAHPDLAAAFDVLSYHPYTAFQIEPPELGNSDTRASLVRMTAAIRAFGQHIGEPADGWPLWNTEMGWATSNVGEDGQALYIVRALLISAALGVERVVLYNATDEDPASDVPLPAEWHYGLIYYDVDAADGSPPQPKPSYLAVQALLQMTAGLAVVLDESMNQVADGANPYLVTLGDASRLVQFVWTLETSTTAFAPSVPPGWRIASTQHIVSGAAGTEAEAGLTLSDDPLAIVMAAD